MRQIRRQLVSREKDGLDRTKERIMINRRVKRGKIKVKVDVKIDK